jgi:hypothetical protein
MSVPRAGSPPPGGRRAGLKGMEPTPRPDPIHDELSEEAKQSLAIEFAILRNLYSSDWHQQWRVYERLRRAREDYIHRHDPWRH